MNRICDGVAELYLRLKNNRRGATALLMGALAVPVFGLTAIAIDAGYGYAIQSRLQSSTDAAAISGALDINCCVSAPTQALATARSYSAITGGKNVIPSVTVTMAAGYPALKCFKSTGISCGGVSAANGIVVRQQATVPSIFGRVLGVNSFTLSATSTASATGGKPKPYDVMIVLDTTASMNSADPNCSISGASRLTCALAGVRIILNTLAPSVDQIGLMVFPGLKNAAQVPLDYDCSSSAPQIAPYNASPVYQITPLSFNYRTADASTSLNAASNIALASQGIASCPQGVSAVGGVGTYYADVITAAQNVLVASGRANTQKVLIFLSDGDANATSGNMPAGKATNQCHAAITAAQAVTAAGTWVYSIAYGASTSTTGSCSTDTPHISACATMQQIASSATKFYADNSSACTSSVNSVADLVAAFNSIAQSLLPPRLLSNDTT